MASPQTSIPSYLVLAMSLGALVVGACGSSTTPTRQEDGSGTGSGSGSQHESGSGDGGSVSGSRSGSGSASGSGTGGHCTSSSTGPNTLVGDCTANDLSFKVAFAGEGQQASSIFMGSANFDGGPSVIPSSLVVTFFDSDVSSDWQAACAADDDFSGSNKSAPTQGRYFQILVAANTYSAPIGAGTYVDTQTSGYTVDGWVGGPNGSGPTPDNGGQVTITSVEGGVASGTFSFTFPTLQGTTKTTLTGTFGKATVCNGSTL